MEDIEYYAEIVNRSKINNILHMSAQMTGKRLQLPGTNAMYRGSKKSPIFASKLFVPEWAPDWASLTQYLWYRLEKKEIKRNAQLVRKVTAFMPSALKEADCIALGFAFGEWMSQKNGTAVEVAIWKGTRHDAFGGEKIDEEPCFYLKMMESLRVLGEDDFGEKAVSQKFFKRKESIIESKRRLEIERLRWILMANDALAQAGKALLSNERPIVPKAITDRDEDDTFQYPTLVDPSLYEKQRGELEEKLNQLQNEANELTRVISEKAKKEPKNGRIRAATLRTLAADVRTTSGHLKKSARLSAADGYFDRSLEQAATSEHLYRTREVLRAISTVITRTLSKTRLITFLRAKETVHLLMHRTPGYRAALKSLHDNLQLSAKALSEIPQTVAPSPGDPPPFPEIVLERLSAELELLGQLLEPLSRRLDPLAELEELAPTPIPSSTEDLEQLLGPANGEVEQWAQQLEQRLGRAPDALEWRGVFIGRVLSQCSGAFAQGLGFNGQYVIYRTEHAVEEGDVVKVEMRSGVPFVEIKHRSPH